MLEGIKLNVCVCVSGAIKHHASIMETIASLKNKYNVVVVCHTWDVAKPADFNHNSWSGNHYHPENVNIFLENIGANKYLVESFEDKYRHFEELKESVDAKRHLRPKNDVGPVSMYYSMWKANELRKEYELENNIKFNCVIKARFDSWITSLNLEDYDLSKLMIPNECDFTGLNDQFAFGSTEGLDAYCGVYPHFHDVLNYCKVYHPETLLKAHMELINYKDVIRPDIKVRINGER